MYFHKLNYIEKSSLHRKDERNRIKEMKGRKKRERMECKIIKEKNMKKVWNVHQRRSNVTIDALI